MNEIEEAEQHLASLLQEACNYKEIKKKYEEALNRQRELHGGLSTIGEIERAKRKLRDVKAGPILEHDSYYKRHLRVIGLTDKMIRTRRDGDGDNQITSFRKSDGKIQGSRTGSTYVAQINTDEALRLWNEWVKK